MPLGVSSSVFNITLGALITIFSTVLAWALLHYNQRRVDRDRTRRTVIHEIDHIADNIEDLIDVDSGQIREDRLDRVRVTLSTDVLKDDLAQINKLTSPEVQSIYDFYESAQVLELRLKKVETEDHIDSDIIRDAARDILRDRNHVHENLKRSRLSLLTEWYKEKDRQNRRSEHINSGE